MKNFSKLSYSVLFAIWSSSAVAADCPDEKGVPAQIKCLYEMILMHKREDEKMHVETTAAIAKIEQQVAEIEILKATSLNLRTDVDRLNAKLEETASAFDALKNELSVFVRYSDRVNLQPDPRVRNQCLYFHSQRGHPSQVQMGDCRGWVLTR